MNLISVYKSRLWKRWYVACGTHIFINTPTWEDAYRAAEMLTRRYSEDQLLELASQDQQLAVAGTKKFIDPETGKGETITMYGWKK